jgi:hypothetical protein
MVALPAVSLAPMQPEAQPRAGGGELGGADVAGAAGATGAGSGIGASPH